MLDTILLAKVMGIFAMLEGLSMVLRRQMLLEVFHEMAKSRSLSYTIGILTTIFGLLIVVRHTTFADTLSSIVTILGWFMVMEGTAYLFLSQTVMARMMHALDRPFCYYSIGAGYLVLGAYLLRAVFIL